MSRRLALSVLIVLTVLLGARLWIASVAPRDVTHGQHGSGGSDDVALAHRNCVGTAHVALRAPLPTTALIGAGPAVGGRGARPLHSVGETCCSTPLYALLRVYRL